MILNIVSIGIYKYILSKAKNAHINLFFFFNVNSDKQYLLSKNCLIGTTRGIYLIQHLKEMT